MVVSVVQAKERLFDLLQAVEDGETVTIARNGLAVGQLTRPAERKPNVQPGGMRDRIRLWPGWDDAVDTRSFLSGDVII